MTKAASSAAPSCPSCGYDLSGAVASWTESCPLTGTCSECGEHLDWPQVVTAADRELPWFIEHGKDRFFRRALGTWVRDVASPLSFWRAVAAHSAASPARLLFWLPLLLVTLHITKATLANGARAIVHVLDNNSFWYFLAWASDDWTQPLVLIYYNPSPGMSVLNTQWQFRWWPPPVWGLIVASVTAPLSLFLAAAWQPQLEIRFGRVARAAVYGLCWIPALWVLAVADSVFRLAYCLGGLATGNPVDNRDVELLFEPLWSAWAIWYLPVGVWWTWWWKCAIAEGVRPRHEGPVQAAVLGLSLCLGVLATATIALVWR